MQFLFLFLPLKSSVNIFINKKSGYFISGDYRYSMFRWTLVQVSFTAHIRRKNKFKNHENNIYIFSFPFVADCYGTMEIMISLTRTHAHMHICTTKCNVVGVGSLLSVGLYSYNVLFYWHFYVLIQSTVNYLCRRTAKWKVDNTTLSE